MTMVAMRLSQRAALSEEPQKKGGNADGLGKAHPYHVTLKHKILHANSYLISFWFWLPMDGWSYYGVAPTFHKRGGGRRGGEGFKQAHSFCFSSSLIPGGLHLLVITSYIYCRNTGRELHFAQRDESVARRQGRTGEVEEGHWKTREKVQRGRHIYG